MNYYALGNRIREGTYEPLSDVTWPRVRVLVSQMIKVEPEARPDIHAVSYQAEAYFRDRVESHVEEAVSREAASVSETVRVHRQLGRAAAVVKVLLEAVTAGPGDAATPTSPPPASSSDSRGRSPIRRETPRGGDQRPASQTKRKKERPQGDQRLALSLPAAAGRRREVERDKGGLGRDKGGLERALERDRAAAADDRLAPLS